MTLPKSFFRENLSAGTKKLLGKGKNEIQIKKKWNKKLVCCIFNFFGNILKQLFKNAIRH